MSQLQKVGAIIFGLVMFMFGFNHIMGAEGMSAMVPFGPQMFLVIFTGLALIAAAITLIVSQFAAKLQKLAGVGQLLLALMLIIFALTLHLPGLGSEDQMTAINAMVSFMKDFALAGAALYFGADLLLKAKA